MSVCAKFQLSSWSRSGLKVPGGVVYCSGVGWGGVWLRPILVFSLSLGQAEQYLDYVVLMTNSRLDISMMLC